MLSKVQTKVTPINQVAEKCTGEEVCLKQRKCNSDIRVKKKIQVYQQVSPDGQDQYVDEEFH